MGASSSNAASAAAPTLQDLDPDDARCMMRNLQLLASRDQSEPGRFGKDAWMSILAAMPPRLAEAIWRAMAANQQQQQQSIGLDDVVRTIVPLRSGQPAAMNAFMAAAFSDHILGSMVAKEDAASWLSSIGKASEAGAAPAQILADAACAAWLIDLRELEPLPTLSEGTTKLLTSKEHLRFLSRALPAGQRREWRLLFTTRRDGTSFSRLVGLCAKRTPVLILVRDKPGGAVFGAYTSEPLSVSPKFEGGYGSFLFRLSSSSQSGDEDTLPALYKASGDNANLVYLNTGMEMLPNGLAFGGNLDARFFGLWIKDDLEAGRSDGPCSTYDNSPCLASSSAFAIDEIEIWAVEADPPPPTEEELAAENGENPLTAAGILSSKHEETRNFLAMAGRKSYVENLGPVEVKEKKDGGSTDSGVAVALQ